MAKTELDEQLRALPGILRAALEKEMRAKRLSKQLEAKIEVLCQGTV
jgi:hypothetical protein